MRSYPYDYTVHHAQDHEVFQWVCDRLEALYPAIVQTGLYRDIDEDETAEYTLDEASIVVHSDFWVDAVYVRSDIPLPLED